MAIKDGGVQAMMMSSLVLCGTGLFLLAVPAVHWAFAVALVVLGAILLITASFARTKARQYSDLHVVEFVELFERLRTKVGKLDPQKRRVDAELPVEVTIPGLRMTWDVRQTDKGLAHRLLFSLHRQPIPYSLAGTMGCLGARHFGIDPSRLLMAQGPDGLVHMGFVLTAEEHAALMQRRQEPIAYGQLQELRRQALTAMQEIRGDHLSDDTVETPRLLPTLVAFEQKLYA